MSALEVLRKWIEAARKRVPVPIVVEDKHANR